jgi:hypothetical protein
MPTPAWLTAHCPGLSTTLATVPAARSWRWPEAMAMAAAEMRRANFRHLLTR